MAVRDPLLRLFGLYRHALGLLIGFVLLAAVLQGTSPWVQGLIGHAIDDLIAGKAVVRTDDGLDLSGAWRWAGILVVANLVRALLGWGTVVAGMALGQRLLTTLRDRILVQIQRLDLAWHRRHGAGEVITRTTRDADKVRDALIGGFRQLVEMTCIVIASVVALVILDPWLGLGPVVAIALAVIIVVTQVGRLVVLDRRVGDAYDQVTQDLGEGVIGVRVIKAFALDGARIARFDACVATFRRESMAALRYTAIRVPIPQFLVALAHVYILGIGIWSVSEGRMSIGALTTAVMIMQGLVFRVEPLGRLMQVFADARSSAARIQELLDSEPAVRDGSEPTPDGPLSVVLRGVGVRSPAGADLLVGVDLRIDPGEVVALIGATGCGKSTLAELLPRLRDPDSGAIVLVDRTGREHDLATLQVQDLRRRVQIAFQDGFLFSDTLAANLRQARADADDARLRRALHQAAAEDLVDVLADGLQTKIGERGVTLSGGQRQRVCLARTLLAEPAVVCFDDATSALDAITERKVLDRLRTESGSTALLLIATKLSTVLLADRIVVLDRGRIVAQGRHEDLLATSAAYRDLIGAEA